MSRGVAKRCKSCTPLSCLSCYAANHFRSDARFDTETNPRNVHPGAT
jgi:hypothetical protein